MELTVSALVAEIATISGRLEATRDAALTMALCDLAALAQRCEASGIPFVVEDHAEAMRRLVGLAVGESDDDTLEDWLDDGVPSDPGWSFDDDSSSK